MSEILTPVAFETMVSGLCGVGHPFTGRVLLAHDAALRSEIERLTRERDIHLKDAAAVREERDGAKRWNQHYLAALNAAEAELAALRLALDTATRERDEWRRHAEEQLADVLRLRFLGIEFASQYGDRALACKYDNSCDDSGREPACIPCAFRSALGLMGVG